MGASVSVQRKAFVELSTVELAAVMGGDVILSAYAGKAETEQLTGKLVSTLGASSVAEVVGMRDPSVVAHLELVMRLHSEGQVSVPTAREMRSASVLGRWARRRSSRVFQARKASEVSESTAEFDFMDEPMVMRSRGRAAGHRLDADAYACVRKSVAGTKFSATAEAQPDAVERIPEEEEEVRGAEAVPDAATRPQEDEEAMDWGMSALLGGADRRARGESGKASGAKMAATPILATTESGRRELASSPGFEHSVIKRLLDDVLADPDGLDRDEFEALMAKHKLFQKAGAEELRRSLFDIFDRDGDGKIDFDEMAGSLAVFHQGSQRERLELVFRVYDRDNSGSVSRSELARLMRSVVIDTRRIVKTALHFEQRVLAAVGATIDSVPLQTHAAGGGSTVAIDETASPDPAPVSATNKKKNTPPRKKVASKHSEKTSQPRRKSKTATGKKQKKNFPKRGSLESSEAVRIQVDNPSGKLDFRVAKDQLLKLLDGHVKADRDFEDQLLQNLADDALAAYDADGNGVLTLDEFEGWAQNNELVQDMISHFSKGLPTLDTA